jgi:AraC-like DNA-binding protein
MWVDTWRRRAISAVEQPRAISRATWCSRPVRSWARTAIAAISGAAAGSIASAHARAFIEQHLGEPDLSPRSVAAAPFVSLRALHNAFEANETTVAEWIRGRRLERCRQDLLDPELGELPVSTIGARWGLLNAAHFSRAFRAAYGMPPSEYRLRT